MLIGTLLLLSHQQTSLAEPTECHNSFTTSPEGGQDQVFSTPFVSLGLEAPPQPLMPKHGWRTEQELEAVIHALAEDGAVLLEGVVDPSVALSLRTHFYDDLIRHPNMEEAIRELGAVNNSEAFYVAERRVGGLRVRRNGARGRFDLKPFDRRDAGVLVQSLGLDSLFEPFLLPPPLRTLLASVVQAPTGWRVKNAGALTTFPHAHTGQWHRDIGDGLFGNESLDLSLPDYYFAALCPLDETTVEQGSELLLGSHTVLAGGLGEAISAGRVRRVIAAAKPGDVLFFSGKVVHRGMPNPTESTRSLVYTVYTAKWFEQGRDASREMYTG